jgi:Vault protein inter-alpha-trypsin domain
MDEQSYQPPYQPKAHVFIFLAGIVLPVISITLEATTHICADTFFDPIPTVWHLLIVIFVPLAQLQGWFAIRRAAPDRLVLAGLANTIVIGISIFYSIVYLPLLPLAALALLVGVGVLPLTPMLSLVAAFLIRRRLKLIAAAPQKSFAIKRSALVAGLIVSIAVIASIELPATLTRIGLQKAVAASPEVRSEGIRFLRKYGDKESLLRSCYNRTGWATDLIGYTLSIRNPVTPEDAQKIYYRVTGETFDSSVPPLRSGNRLQPQDEFDFDLDQGRAKIGGKLKGLFLSASKLDASIDADAAVGYMEWTLVFQNQADVLREARAEVQLPPGAVVSRLTLWVNGEEREAAFAGRNQARNAYQQVAIRQRRDPVLVTTAGRDRILVQCFPVLAHGEMKIRFGVTAPLVLENRVHAQLVLPHFVNRNFRIPDDVHHAVWIESKTPMASWNASRNDDSNGVYAQRRAFDDAELSQPQSSISFERADVTEVWSHDPFDPAFVVRQSLQERTTAHLQRIVIVVDTSEAMRGDISEIREAIRSLPKDFDVKLLLADIESKTGNNMDVLWPRDASWSLEDNFVGGADNQPALVKAWDLAAEKPGNNAIVWIHSPQRLLLGSVEELRQRWERRPFGPTLYSVKTTAGADEIEKNLDGINEVKSVARVSYLKTDLDNLFARLTGSTPTLEFVRTSTKMTDELDLSGAKETSAHLARLWANDEVTRILSPRDQSLNDAATTLAVRYQLVTPVSGAVVLETDEQYRANGLKPVDAGTVPTIPEPEIVALLLVASLFIVWLFYIKRRGRSGGRYTI